MWVIFLQITRLHSPFSLAKYGAGVVQALDVLPGYPSQNATLSCAHIVMSWLMGPSEVENTILAKSVIIQKSD